MIDAYLYTPHNVWPAGYGVSPPVMIVVDTEQKAMFTKSEPDPQHGHSFKVTAKYYRILKLERVAHWHAGRDCQIATFDHNS